MKNSIPDIQLDSPLAIESSPAASESETLTKSRVVFFAGSAVTLVFVALSIGIGYLAATKPVVQSTPVEEKKIVVTPTPEPIIDRSSVRVDVLNGSGKVGKAKEIAKQLEQIGYSINTVGNASRLYKQSIVLLNAKTTATIAANIRKDFKDVDQQESDELRVDVQYIIGADVE